MRELPFGYFEKQLNCNKISECLFYRQFSIIIFLCLNEHSFCTMRMEWKVAVLKTKLACHCLSERSPPLVYTVLLNIERCNQFLNDKLLFRLATVGCSCGEYVSIGITLYQKPQWDMLWANQCLEILFFFSLFEL